MTKEELKQKLVELEESFEQNKEANETEKKALQQKVDTLEKLNTALAEVLKTWLTIRGSSTSVELFQSTSAIASITTQILNSVQESKK